jgi:hypothetical protein
MLKVISKNVNFLWSLLGQHVQGGGVRHAELTGGVHDGAFGIFAATVEHCFWGLPMYSLVLTLHCFACKMLCSLCGESLNELLEMIITVYAAGLCSNANTLPWLCLQLVFLPCA